MKILLVDSSTPSLTEICTKFTGFADVDITTLNNSEKALECIRAKKVDAVAVAANLDSGSGLDWIKQAVPLNPFINYALSSDLSTEQFHEVTEGYGVFMQLSQTPKSNEADIFLEKLKKIASL